MIIGFHGNMRGGKTLNMSVLGLIIAGAVKADLYANYSLKTANRFEKWRDLNGVFNSILCYDEIGTAMDSRNFKSADQIYFTHLFAQMGKLGNTFLYTTQRMHSVEKRIRDNTDYIFHCERLWPLEKIKVTVYDTRQSMEAPTKITEYTLEDPSKFYHIYDSFELIKSHIKIEK